MFAKFNGVCETCDGRVARGSRGVYDTKARRFHHFACAVDSGLVEPDNTPEKAADARKAPVTVEPARSYVRDPGEDDADRWQESQYQSEPDWSELMAEKGDS